MRLVFYNNCKWKVVFKNCLLFKNPNSSLQCRYPLTCPLRVGPLFTQPPFLHTVSATLAIWLVQGHLLSLYPGSSYPVWTTCPQFFAKSSFCSQSHLK